MPRPTITRTAVATGVQQLTKTYDDGRVAVRYLGRVRKDGTLTRVGTFTTRKAAEAAYRRALTLLESGDYVEKKARKMPFLEVANHWLAHHPGTWAPRTLATNKDIVDRRLKALHKLPISGVTYEVVTPTAAGRTTASPTPPVSGRTPFSRQCLPTPNDATSSAATHATK